MSEPNLYFKEPRPIQPRFIGPQQRQNKEAEHLDIETGLLHVHKEETAAEEKTMEIQKPEQKPESKEAYPIHAEEDRVPTGIPGLDEAMEGGFRRNTVNLIAGGAGSGKSIFSMQFLAAGIEQYHENCIYISFDETEEKIIEEFKRFKWDLEEKIRNKQLMILHYSPEQVERVLEAGGGTVRDSIESIQAKRLVIDSLTSFTLLHDSELAKRKALLQLFDAMQKWNVTALLTSEQEPDPEKHVSTVVEFEVDGVILLYNVRKGDIRERSLEVFKMRSTKHSAKIFPMKIGNKGVRIYPEEAVF